jgi:hypothetical protein
MRIQHEGYTQMMSSRLGLFVALASFHLIIFNVLRGVIAHEDDTSFDFIDVLGWIDARSPRARLYRTITFLWIFVGAIGAIVLWTV